LDTATDGRNYPQLWHMTRTTAPNGTFNSAEYLNLPWLALIYIKWTLSIYKIQLRDQRTFYHITPYLDTLFPAW